MLWQRAFVLASMVLRAIVVCNLVPHSNRTPPIRITNPVRDLAHDESVGYLLPHRPAKSALQ
jgi:hypothetical protein